MSKLQLEWCEKVAADAKRRAELIAEITYVFIKEGVEMAVSAYKGNHKYSTVVVLLLVHYIWSRVTNLSTPWRQQDEGDGLVVMTRVCVTCIIISCTVAAARRVHNIVAGI